MGIGKESLFTLESFARQQIRIYPDACDCGVWETPANRAAIRAALAELKDLEGGVATKWSNGCSFRTRLGLEMDGRAIVGVEIIVARHSPRNTDPFYSIEIRRTQWRANEPIARD